MGIAVIAALGLVWYRSASRPGPTARVVVTSQPTVKIDRAEGGKGELSVSATASVGHRFEAQELRWRLKVFRRIPDGAGTMKWDLAWRQDYDHRTFVTRAGQVRTSTFTERLILPAGRYTLELGVDELTRGPGGGVQARTIGSDVANVKVE
jgi:hypothetical protein